MCFQWDRKTTRRFEREALVYHEIGERLLSHLDPIVRAPHHILNLNCATGAFARRLAARFRQAKISGFDVSEDMVRRAKKRKPLFFSKQTYQVSQFPKTTTQYDLVFVNLLDFRQKSPGEFFSILKPLMTEQAVILFSCLGPGCLASKNKAFVDMHDIGDALMASGFLYPVMESERLMVGLNPGLSVSRQLQYNRLDALSSVADDALLRKEEALSLEVIYGHAFLDGAAANQTKSTNTFEIKPEAILRSHESLSLKRNP